MSGNSSAAAGKAKNKKTVPKEEKRKKMLVNLKKPRKQGWFKPGTDDEAGSVVSSVAGSESRIPTSRPPEIIGNMPPPEVNTENVVRKFPRRPSFLGLFNKPVAEPAASVVSSAGSESRIPTSHPPEIIENMPPLEVNTENVVRKFPRRPSFLQSPSQQDVDVSDSPKPVRSAKKDRPTHTKVDVKDSTRSRPPRPPRPSTDGAASVVSSVGSESRTSPPEVNTENVVRKSPRRPSFLGLFNKPVAEGAASVVSSAGSESRNPTSHPPEIIENMPPLEVNTENVVRKFPRRPSFLQSLSKPDTDGAASVVSSVGSKSRTSPPEVNTENVVRKFPRRPSFLGLFSKPDTDGAAPVVSSVGSESRIPTSHPPEIIGNMPPPEVNTENVVRKFPRRPSFLGLFSKPDTDGAASVVSSAGSESRIPTSHPPEIIENMPPLEVNTENVVRKFPRRPSFLQSPSQQDVDVSDSPKPVRSAKKDRPTHTKVGVKDSTRSRPPRPQSIRSPSPRPPSVRSRSPRSSTVRSRSRSASPRRPSFRSRSASPRPPSFRDRRSSSNGRSSQCAQDLVSDKDRPLYTQPNSMTEVTKKRALKEKVVSVKDHDVYTRSASMTEATERRALREKAFLSCAEKMTTTWKEEREEDALGDDIEQQEVSQVLQECD